MAAPASDDVNGVAPADPTRPPSGVTVSAAQKVQVFGFLRQEDAPATLSWHDIKYTVKTTKGGWCGKAGGDAVRKRILHDVCGELKPGELNCILGPSGSGKTTLLNVLSGRTRNGGRSAAQIGGNVYLNGKAIDPATSHCNFAYVMQDEALLGTMTPREVIDFAARLRLCADAKKSKDQLVDNIIMALGLSKCANCVVGNALIKGISGGERKRTAVGAELIMNPATCFLDEPTSGLDVSAAYNLVSILKQLALCQRSVMCTIHQPSSEIFNLFDKATFLVAGQVVYQGPPAGIRSAFQRIGKECPKDFNPADFVLFVIHESDPAEVEQIVKACPKPEPPQLDDQAGGGMPAPARAKGVLNPCEEIVVLLKRESQKVIRDTGTLGARFGSTAFLTLIFALVFQGIGEFGESDYDLQSHLGACTMLCISTMFGVAQPLLLTFSDERAVFLTERANNMYGTVPYFLTKVIVEVPLVVLQNVLVWLIAYWAMSFNGNFAILLLGTTLQGLAAGAIALLMASLVADAKQAMELAPALFVPQILFAGLFIKIDLIPAYMRWLRYICSLKWGCNIVLLTELADAPGGEVWMSRNDVDPDELLMYCGILVALILGFQILAAVALTRKARNYFN